MLESVSTWVQKDYHRYLNPNKKQHSILFNRTAWESNKQVHPERLHHSSVVHADTAEQVIAYTNTFVRENFCSAGSALNVCSSSLYQQAAVNNEIIREAKTSLTAK